MIALPKCIMGADRIVKKTIEPDKQIKLKANKPIEKFRPFIFSPE